MFKFLSVALISALISSNAFAKECIIRAGESKLVVGSLVRETILNVTEIDSEELNTWDKCYEKAVDIVSEVDDNEVPRFPVGWIIKESSESRKLTTKYTWVEWTFNDSWLPLLDTRGIVNYFTPLYTVAPDSGDLRVDSEGFPLKDSLRN